MFSYAFFASGPISTKRKGAALILVIVILIRCRCGPCGQVGRTVCAAVFYAEARDDALWSSAEPRDCTAASFWP